MPHTSNQIKNACFLQENTRQFLKYRNEMYKKENGRKMSPNCFQATEIHYMEPDNLI